MRIIQRPASIGVLFSQYVVQGAGEAWVSAQTQADLGFQVLKQVGDVKHREAELPPVAGGFVGVTGGIGSVQRVYPLFTTLYSLFPSLP